VLEIRIAKNGFCCSGITSEYVATSDNVPGSFFHEVSPAYYERCNQMVDQLYLQFKQRVAEGRRMDIEHVESLAQGRVYTGREDPFINIFHSSLASYILSLFFSCCQDNKRLL
jgi:hypothetical protein